MMNKVEQPLSNVQLKILKAFFYNLTDEELKYFRETIAIALKIESVVR